MVRLLHTTPSRTCVGVGAVHEFYESLHLGIHFGLQHKTHMKPAHMLAMPYNNADLGGRFWLGLFHNPPARPHRSLPPFANIARRHGTQAAGGEAERCDAT